MKTVLIIDDDKTLLAVYTNLLQQEGYTPLVSEDANKALQILKEKPVDLVLLDIMLPGGMNGFELLEKIKRDAATKSIPVVILTNLESEKDTGLDLGAVDYLIKANMDVKSILEKVQKYT